MSLYIQQLAKLIGNQLGRLYRHFGANSDGAAWFLICTSLISQHQQDCLSQSRVIQAHMTALLHEMWVVLILLTA
jgi:hypothetical protein